MITGLDHVDVIVKDLEAGIEQYKKILGTDEVTYVDSPGERPYKMARFDLPNGQSINVLSPTTGVGPWARHLERHGEGIYLFALTVDDLEQDAEAMHDRGVRFPVPIGGTRVIHPASAGGALILLSQQRH